MAADGAVISEFQETPRGSLPVARTSGADTPDPVPAKDGSVLGEIGTVISDGEVRAIGYA